MPVSVCEEDDVAAELAVTVCERVDGPVELDLTVCEELGVTVWVGEDVPVPVCEGDVVPVELGVLKICNEARAVIG